MLLKDAKKFILDRNSPIPLYYQIYNFLSEKIKNPEMVGSKIPSEETLMNFFGVSRDTIRKALQLLKQEGVIESIPGKGTKVIRSIGLDILTSLRSFTEQMRLEKHVALTKVISVEWIKAGKKFSKLFEINEKDKILKIERLKGNELTFPIVFFISYISPASNLTGTEDFNGSLYELLNKLNKPIIKGDATIEARLADDKIAKLLKTEKNSPILFFERLGRTYNNLPIELVQGWFIGKLYKFRIHLTTK